MITEEDNGTKKEPETETEKEPVTETEKETIIAPQMEKEETLTPLKLFYFNKLERLQLSMILLVVLGFILFLVLQTKIAFFDVIRPQLLAINVLFGLGIAVEIGHFTFLHLKRVQKNSKEN